MKKPVGCVIAPFILVIAIIGMAIWGFNTTFNRTLGSLLEVDDPVTASASASSGGRVVVAIALLMVASLLLLLARRK